jgi:hypothetical protein
MPDHTLTPILTEIATKHLGLRSLDTPRRPNGGNEFHEVAVWELRAALEAAYVAGRAAGADDTTNKDPR